MAEKIEAPYTYNLTAMVGRRSDDGRTMIVATFEVQKRHLVVAIAAAIPALLVALVFGTVIGTWAIIVFLLVEAAVFYLVEGRSRDGLRLRTYQHLNDKRVANTGRVFVCGREVDPSVVEIIDVKGATIDVPCTGATVPVPAATVRGLPSAPRSPSKAVLPQSRRELTPAAA